MKNFFYDQEFSEEVQINDSETINYWSNVLRLPKGTKLNLYNEEKNCIYLIEKISKDSVFLSKISEFNNENFEKNGNLSLLFSPLKKNNTELVLQKATEIGINKVILADFQRSVVKYKKDFEKKKNKLMKIIIGAMNQSNRTSVLQVDYKDLKMVNYDCYDLIITAYEKEKVHTLHHLEKEIIKSKNILIIIGPEGGFDDVEVEFLKSKNSRIITLGKEILRAETANILIISQIKYILEGKNENSSS